MTKIENTKSLRMRLLEIINSNNDDKKQYFISILNLFTSEQLEIIYKLSLEKIDKTILNMELINNYQNLNK